MNTQTDVQAVAYTAADTTNGAKLTFKGVSETDGIIAQGSGSTELQFAKVATTGAAGDVSYTNTTSGLTATDTQAAIDELNSKITNANITIDGHKGAITFGTVEVTAGNGLTLTDGVVAYAHNTTAVNIASKDSTTNVITVEGTLTPDASDAITTSNTVTFAPVAATGNASDVSVTPGTYGGSTSVSNAQDALNNLATALCWEVYA